jgi:hypothetical protein
MNMTEISVWSYNTSTFPLTANHTVCMALCDSDRQCKAWSFHSDPNNYYCDRHSEIACAIPSGTGSSCGVKEEITLEHCTDAVDCTMQYTPPTNMSEAFSDMPVRCGTVESTVPVLNGDRSVELRILLDNRFGEVFWQQGRAAMTVGPSEGSALSLFNATSPVIFSSTADLAVNVDIYPMNGIWTSAAAVRKEPRVFH